MSGKRKWETERNKENLKYTYQIDRFGLPLRESYSHMRVGIGNGYEFSWGESELYPFIIT